MSCQFVRMKDGTVLLANVKPGAALTPRDLEALAAYMKFCRERTAKTQRDRNAKLLPGGVS